MMISRRRYLAALAALGAGCAGGSNSTPTPTATPTDTPTATPTPTPTPTRTPRQFDDLPKMIEANILTGWSEFGDVYDNQMSRIPPNVEFSVGSRVEAEVHNGEVTLEMQAEIYQGDGLVERESTHTSTLTQETTPVEWGIAVGMDSVGWEVGNDYRAEVIVQDETSGNTTETSTATFAVDDSET